MRRILIATTNPAKLAEYRLLLREFRLEPISLTDAGIKEAPKETGATFAENALLKVRFYFQRAQIATIADDGGLEIDALGGEPGVRSHRWIRAGDNSDRALVNEVMRRMAGVEPGRRSARLRAAAALAYEEGGEIRERLAEAAVEGVIAERAHDQIRRGFPYRAVLFIPELNRYLGELGEEEEALISQRRKSVMMLSDDLKRIAEAR
jgi:XTP/dITP diphosphohydrolase